MSSRSALGNFSALGLHCGSSTCGCMEASLPLLFVRVVNGLEGDSLCVIQVYTSDRAIVCRWRVFLLVLSDSSLPPSISGSFPFRRPSSYPYIGFSPFTSLFPLISTYGPSHLASPVSTEPHHLLQHPRRVQNPRPPVLSQHSPSRLRTTTAPTRT